MSARLFCLLAISPAMRRSFLPQEDNPAAASGTDPVILSYGLWQREFGSDPAVLGRAIRLSGQPFTVISVMPAKFQFPIEAEPIQLWTTIAVDARGGGTPITDQRRAHYLDVVGLSEPGVKLQQAQTEMVCHHAPAQ